MNVSKDQREEQTSVTLLQNSETKGNQECRNELPAHLHFILCSFAEMEEQEAKPELEEEPEAEPEANAKLEALEPQEKNQFPV